MQGGGWQGEAMHDMRMHNGAHWVHTMYALDDTIVQLDAPV